MKKSIVIFILFVLGVAGFAGYYYVNRSVQSISGSEADITVSPQNLLNEFVQDEQAANAKYLDKIIAMEGKIHSISSDENGKVNILLDTGNPMSSISCQLEKDEAEKAIQLKQKDKVRIKGICTGMLMDVIIVNCVIED